MSDEILADSLVLYIEREISKPFGIEEIVEDFKALKEHQALL